MTPEAQGLLDKASRSLAEARFMLAGNFSEGAGRAAYIAGLNAAQALIFERSGRVGRTHKGIQGQFYALIADDAEAPTEIKSFLSKAYEFKAISDYWSNGLVTVSDAEARAAIGVAETLLAYITTLLGPPV